MNIFFTSKKFVFLSTHNKTQFV